MIELAELEKNKKIRVAIRRKYVEFTPVDKESWFYEIAHYTNKVEKYAMPEKRWVTFRDLPNHISYYGEMSSGEPNGTVVSYPDTEEIVYSGVKKQRKTKKNV